MESPGLQGFLPHVGESFITLCGGIEIRMVLTEASALGDGTSSSAFSLVFHSQSSAPCPQGLYRLGHPMMGEQEIFLVPIGRHDDGFVCEAVFN